MEYEHLITDFGSVVLPALEQSFLAAVLIDERDQVAYFNEAAERLWGYKRGEVLMQSMELLLPESLSVHIRADRRDDAAAGEGINQDIMIRHPDGKQQWLRISLSRVSVSGRSLHLAFARDVTEDLALRMQNSRLLAAANHTDRPILVLDKDRRIVQVNRAFTESFGYKAEEVVGQDPATIFVSPLMARDDVESFLRLPWGKSRVQAEALVRGKSGREFWVRIASSPIDDNDLPGLSGHSVDVVSDVTEERLIRNLERDVLEALVSNLSFSDLGNYLCQRVRAIAPDVIPSILLVDDQRRLRPWAASGLSASYSQALDGVEIGESVGSCGTAAYRGEPVLVGNIAVDPCWEDYRHLALPYGLQACWSFPVKRRDGTVACTFAFYFNEPRSQDTFHERIAEVCQHLSVLAIELEENRQQMVRMVRFDTLTGLPNRSYLHQYVRELLSGRKGPIAFIGLDLDRFKDINSVFGHSVGDQVLVAIANRLQERLSPGTFLCRAESDLFFIVLDNCDVHRASATAEHVQAIVGEPIEVVSQVLNLSVSIGISHSTEGENDRELLLAHAKSAIFEVKAAGGGAFKFFSPEMNHEARERLLLGARLKRAIADGAMCLMYQPQVFSSGGLYGVEALARWHDPELGDIPPGKFIGLAEETGDIQAIGRWALHEACRQMAQWRDQNVRVSVVSVNLSPFNFRNEGLPAYVSSLLREYSLPGECLTIEITESLMMMLDSQTLAILQQLRELGIGLSVDDFGTGYSCLSNLASLPVTELKIDRSFIDQCLQQPRLQSLVEAVLGIGRGLGLTVVAEGVETEAQRAMLVEQRCPVMQGYLFSRAISADSLSQWLCQEDVISNAACEERGRADSKSVELIGVKDEGELCLPSVVYDIVAALPIAASWAALPGGVIQYTNGAFDTLFGYPSGHFRTVDQFIEQAYIHENQRRLLREQWNNFALSEGNVTTTIPDVEVEIRTSDGQKRSLMHCGLILHQHQLAVAIFKDISDYKRDHQMLRDFAFLDPLTGLVNRRGLKEQWEEEHRSVSGQRRLAFLMVDLDGFKPINDTYGHEVGDNVLRSVAARLKEAVREVDLVCRLGGDEFGIMMAAPHDFNIVVRICDRIVDSLQEPIRIGQASVRISVSVGGCLYPDQAADKRELLRRADEALYRVKKTGKGGWGWWGREFV